ncbi:hypothetical protein Aau02nite_13700 [Amorphoplanes auranticolor]|uniref:Uncharacterized protein n=1 Tax=Actinoplanes auranticolor TaxID=47988 RepID=A0A919VJ81_9ACTN|nr:hypothetical protein Aau02nite_13700 [Actinoplanes auranticolor]
MSNKHQVDEAVDIARSLVDDEVPVSSPVLALTELARRFAATEFDVPEDQDADGYLFQYGKVGWLPQPTFVVSMVRQLEVVDSDGEHEFYSQVQFEYRFPLDRDLEKLESHSEWWFPGGATPFGAWLESVSRSPIGDLLGSREPREFLVWADQS